MPHIVDDSIYKSALNKTKKEIFHQVKKFDNIIEYIVFIMEIVETYEYLSGPEKHEVVIRIARSLDLAFVSIFDDDFISTTIISQIILASKGKLKINNFKKRSFLKSLICRF